MIVCSPIGKAGYAVLQNLSDIMQTVHWHYFAEILVNEIPAR